MVVKTRTMSSRPRTTMNGLLITRDPSLARAFRRELANCVDCTIAFDLQPNFDEATRAGRGSYHCVTVDLDGMIAPQEAIRLARNSWPLARVAVISFWWSEQSELVRDLADVVIHKPLRAAELRAFLRSPTGAPKLPEEQPTIAAAS